ncbi:MAG: type II CAAX endopeptidase family protein [Cyanobacteria bacterium P01_A01_bin.17]
MIKDRKLYKLILSILTFIVVTMIGLQLVSSWTQPQAQSQLNLYESDLLLQASTWQETNDAEPGTSPLLEGLWGDSDPVQQALKNYQKIRASATTQNGQTDDPQKRAASEAFVNELDVRLGLLYARSGQVEDAIATWTPLAEASPSAGNQRTKTAAVLQGLWSDPPQLQPQAQQQLKSQLKGWFRYQSLSQLYQLQQRQETLTTLRAREHAAAEKASTRLATVQVFPAIGGLTGVGILIFWLIQFVVKKRQNTEPDSPASTIEPIEAPTDQTPNTPQELAATVRWPVTTIWQVMVVWFAAFFCVSFILPVVLYVAGAKPETFGARGQAYLALIQYSLLMGVGFSILYLSLKPFLSQPLKWLPLRWQGSWFSWGLSGYLAALPLVIAISVLNQKLLQNQGGGNPLLEIILNSHDRFSMGLLLFMVAVLAPLFEEILFRGFFLTSLTRYLPMWGAIGLSGVVFAIAHLNLSDILPLTVLGCMLGFVYTRSQNLLASMLLHGLWNSGSFIGLIILGSSVS